MGCDDMSVSACGNALCIPEAPTNVNFDGEVPMPLGFCHISAKRAGVPPIVMEPCGQFEEHMVPPVLPSDPCFFLESTSFSVNGISANLLGKRLLDVLQSQASANVTKITQSKFSLKARVSMQGRDCDVKVRVFTMQFGYEVEFQRRSGDAVAFNDVYRLAKDRLRPQENYSFGAGAGAKTELEPVWSQQQCALSFTQMFSEKHEGILCAI